MDGQLLPFKKGAFRIALSEQLPVLPVTLLGTERIMPPGSLGIFPGRAQVIIHPAIEPPEGSADGLRDLMKATHDTIASALPVEIE